eukprot:12095735-Alexandrium_andersonii.AAC.1
MLSCDQQAVCEGRVAMLLHISELNVMPGTIELVQEPVQLDAKVADAGIELVMQCQGIVQPNRWNLSMIKQGSQGATHTRANEQQGDNP